MNGWGFLRSLQAICHFQTREGKKVGRASNSELKRWLQNGVALVNGERLEWDEPVDFQVHSMSLFSGEKKITLL